MTTTQTIDDQVLQAIREVQDRKRADRKHPDHVLLIKDGLFERFASQFSDGGLWRVLDRMEAQGKIKQGRTINDTFVCITNESIDRNTK